MDITTLKTPEDVREALATGAISTATAKIIAQVINEKKGNVPNKPGMTLKDKINKQKAIKFLVDHNMDTSENLKRLEAVNYTANHIEIGGVRRAREDVKAKPDGKNIFQHGATAYFKRDEVTMKKQTASLAKQGMEIASKEHFARSMAALPGDFKESDGYAGGSILGILLGMQMSGAFNNNGHFFHEGAYGFAWTSSKIYNSFAWNFAFSPRKGLLHRDDKNSALPLRAVYK